MLSKTDISSPKRILKNQDKNFISFESALRVQNRMSVITKRDESMNLIKNTDIHSALYDKPNKLTIASPKKLLNNPYIADKSSATSSFMKRKLYGDQWYLNKNSWMKSMLTHKHKSEFIQIDEKTGSSKNKSKFEFQRMLSSMKAANLLGKAPISPFTSQVYSYSNEYHKEEPKSNKKNDIHEKFVHDIISHHL